MKKINQGFVGESSEWREGRKDKRFVGQQRCSQCHYEGSVKPVISERRVIGAKETS